MAVKKAKKEEEIQVTEQTTAVEENAQESVDVSEQVDTETAETNEEVEAEEPQQEVVIDTEEPKTEEPDVQVDTETAKVNSANKPTERVKIRMRTDHRCTIAMEQYDLKAGKTYTVPRNVKNILNRAGLLSPL